MIINGKNNYIYKCSLVAFAAMMITLSSCSNDEPFGKPEAGDSISFTTSAQIDGGASSRVSYDQQQSKIKVTWEKDDVVKLFLEGDTTAAATFVVTEVDANNNLATFTCNNPNGIANIESVTGTMKYTPKMPAKTGSDVDIYAQAFNGNTNEKQQDIRATQHLQYTNGIEAILNGVNFKENGLIQFKNTTAVFRIIIPAPRNIVSGATLTMYGADTWGTGISQTLDFEVTKGNEIVAYIAAPAGKLGRSLSVALVDGSDKNSATRSKVTTYYAESTATYYAGREYTADFTQKQSWDSEIDGTQEFVDMGGDVLWGTKNLDATGLTGDISFGGYYAWGSTTAATGGFTHDGEYSKVAYNKNLDTLVKDGIIVSTTNPVLTPEHDAATQHNKDWFTPTYEHWNQLLDNCIWVWNSALKGYEVISSTKDAVIFMPAAGFYDSNNLNNRGHYAYYWTSTAKNDDQNSWGMHISGPHRSIAEQSYPRYQGYNIRPVKNKTEGGQSTTDETKTDQTTGK